MGSRTPLAKLAAWMACSDEKKEMKAIELFALVMMVVSFVVNYLVFVAFFLDIGNQCLSNLDMWKKEMKERSLYLCV